MAPQRRAPHQKVLVATDGSRGGIAALRFAARLASCPRTALTVITVDTDGGSRAGEHGRLPAAGALSSAARLLQRLHVSADYRVVEARTQEPIPDAIARESERLKADLVVVGSEGRDTLREWVLGGVALRLVYLARRPVTVVRPPRRRRAP